MFTGHYLHNIDAKNRISVPAKYLKYFPEGVERKIVLTRGVGMDSLGRCIDLYPIDKWLPLQERMDKLNPFKEEDAKFIRLLSFGMTDDKIDSQGRLILPAFLLEHAGIEKEILILGAIRKIEIWNPRIYKTYSASIDQPFDKIAEKVMSF